MVVKKKKPISIYKMGIYTQCGVCRKKFRESVLEVGTTLAKRKCHLHEIGVFAANMLYIISRGDDLTPHGLEWINQ